MIFHIRYAFWGINMRIPSKLLRTSRNICLWLLILGMPVQSMATDPPPEAYNNGIFDWHARTFFWVNRQIFWGLDVAGELLFGANPDQANVTNGIVEPHTALGLGISNMAANVVNEPVTAVTNLLIGDFSTAWVATQRFGINSTVGILGWYDVAKDWLDLQPTVTDVGLVMCKAGVGEGSYLVLPFVGPRTLRDGLADIVLTNLILWTAVGVTLGTGASWETILIAETVEILADLIATRQIDPNAKVTQFEDFEAVRKAYLEQRRARCNALRNAGVDTR